MNSQNYLLLILVAVLIIPAVTLNPINAQEVSSPAVTSNATTMQGIACPAVTSNATTMQGMSTFQQRPTLSAEEFFSQVNMTGQNIPTIIITNQSVSIAPDTGLATIGNQTFRTTGDNTFTSDCDAASSYHIRILDDGTQECGVHDACTGQSYSVPCNGG